MESCEPTRYMTISELRRSANAIWASALDAATPEKCIRNAVRLIPRGFAVSGTEVVLEGRLVVVGAGKAAAGMAQVIESLFEDRITRGVVITKYGHRLPTERIEVLEAGHPIPDEAGRSGVERLRASLGGLSREDVVLCLISGGASALMPMPAEGVTLAGKAAVTSQLLRAGARIRELNAVRKHLSAVKGGQMVRWAAPARIVSLIISDVIGDPVSFIASGPTSPDTSTFEDATEVLRRYRVDAPPEVLRRLDAGVRGELPETPKEGDPLFERVSNHIIGNNRIVLRAAAGRAETLGFHTIILTAELEGEAREAGRLFAAIGREVTVSGQPVPAPACILAGGETTVQVRGDGVGGRNLEAALAWALDMKEWKAPSCFASIATDGTDGPTDAAGAVVDPTTYNRARERDLDPSAHLEGNDSLRILDAVGDSVRTGPTQTNLMDLQILLVG